MRKKIGVGYENFKEFIDEEMYYADKTLLIRDVLENGGKVTLFTRPRRFGKTLALSMLRTFFEAEVDRNGEAVDNRRYFSGMKVMECGEEVLSKMGRYPVIKLSLKSAMQPTLRGAFLKIRDEIVDEYGRHIYVDGSELLTPAQRQSFASFLLPRKAEEIRTEEELAVEMDLYSTALRTLSDCLYKYHGQKVVVLLDEYDVPLENAYFSGFYSEMIGFIRSLFESALKTNDSLEFAVVTGCLRISRESIFTGMNNLKINSIRDERFSEGFGFTEVETEKMLREYGMEDRIPEAKEWYNGYLFGKNEIYNPWSITAYVDAIANNGRKFAEAYWANTSSNSIIKDMVFHADDDVKEELDLLIQGGTIEKMIHEDITYGDIHESEDNLWNFLFFTGYMKEVSERREGKYILATMKIPNLEVASIYERQIKKWFEDVVKASDRGDFYRAVLEGDTTGMEDFLNVLLDKCISTFDSAESFYHGFFLSLLFGLPGYTPKSNREAGDGRPDIVLEPKRPRDPAIIFELKRRKKFSQMQGGIREAFGDIREKRYEEGVLDDGFLGVKSYGVCFCRKSCIIERYPGGAF